MKKTLAEKQLEMRRRHEPRSVRLGRACGQVKRIIRYLEQFPGQAHADAMRIAEQAWYDLRREQFDFARQEYNEARARHCWFKKQGV